MSFCSPEMTSTLSNPNLPLSSPSTPPCLDGVVAEIRRWEVNTVALCEGSCLCQHGYTNTVLTLSGEHKLRYQIRVWQSEHCCQVCFWLFCLSFLRPSLLLSLFLLRSSFSHTSPFSCLCVSKHTLKQTAGSFHVEPLIEINWKGMMWRTRGGRTHWRRHKKSCDRRRGGWVEELLCSQGNTF